MKNLTQKMLSKNYNEHLEYFSNKPALLKILKKIYEDGSVYLILNNNKVEAIAPKELELILNIINEIDTHKVEAKKSGINCIPIIGTVN